MPSSSMPAATPAFPFPFPLPLKPLSSSSSPIQSCFSWGRRIFAAASASSVVTGPPSAPSPSKPYFGSNLKRFFLFAPARFEEDREPDLDLDRDLRERESDRRERDPEPECESLSEPPDSNAFPRSRSSHAGFFPRIFFQKLGFFISASSSSRVRPCSAAMISRSSSSSMSQPFSAQISRRCRSSSSASFRISSALRSFSRSASISCRTFSSSTVIPSLEASDFSSSSSFFSAS
mmetsp:Transcript_4258/g.10359  ORF Transcript_4258/g.10359 Transcript_4258/m.10359 type:complete len:234 (+) Transcript_4258:6357-7058(+)